MAKQGYCAAGGGEPPEEWEREERREAAEGAEAVDGRDLLPGVDSDDEESHLQAAMTIKKMNKADCINYAKKKDWTILRTPDVFPR